MKFAKKDPNKLTSNNELPNEGNFVQEEDKEKLEKTNKLKQNMNIQFPEELKKNINSNDEPLEFRSSGIDFKKTKFEISTNFKDTKPNSGLSNDKLIETINKKVIKDQPAPFKINSKFESKEVQGIGINTEQIQKLNTKDVIIILINL